MQGTLLNSQKCFLFEIPKMAAILNFKIFDKNGRLKIAYIS